MNMMREIWQTTRLALSFRACRRELDAIDQLPNEQLAEREQRLSRLRAINMLEQVCLFIILFSFLLMSIYDIGNYLMQLLHESNTLLLGRNINSKEFIYSSRVGKPITYILLSIPATLLVPD